MRIHVDPHDSTSPPKGRIVFQNVHATSEQGIDLHQKIDDAAELWNWNPARGWAVIDQRPSNVYKALGLPNADDLMLKATIASGISDILKQRYLTEAEASQLIGIAQSELSSILKGQFRNISTAKMMGSLNLLERSVKWASQLNRQKSFIVDRNSAKAAFQPLQTKRLVLDAKQTLRWLRNPRRFSLHSGNEKICGGLPDLEFVDSSTFRSRRLCCLIGKMPVV